MKVVEIPIIQMKRSGKNGPVSNANGNKYNNQELADTIYLFINLVTYYIIV